MVNSVSSVFVRCFVWFVFSTKASHEWWSSFRLIPAVVWRPPDDSFLYSIPGWFLFSFVNLNRDKNDGDIGEIGGGGLLIASKSGVCQSLKAKGCYLGCISEKMWRTLTIPAREPSVSCPLPYCMLWYDKAKFFHRLNDTWNSESLRASLVAQRHASYRSQYWPFLSGSPTSHFLTSQELMSCKSTRPWPKACCGRCTIWFDDFFKSISMHDFHPIPSERYRW